MQKILRRRGGDPDAHSSRALTSDLIEWADLFDKANKETRHMILARLIERVEVGAGYKVTVKFKITYEQFLGIAA